jgi:hypothetical protein
MACTGGGPPVVVGGTPGNNLCTGDLAKVTFRWALCSCKDVQTSSELTTDGFDSTMGPYMPGGVGGGVGVNRQFGASSTNIIGGALWASASSGLDASSECTIKQELHSGGPLQLSAPWTIGDDTYVNGDVSGSGTTIAGALHVPDGANVSGVTSQSVVHEPVSVPPPCDCAPDQLVPIAAIVDDQKTHNDNATIGLDPGALSNPQDAIRLDLPCGRYYLDSISSSNEVTVVAHGRTALFIGDVNTSGDLTITLDPIAELDVFIKGGLSTSSLLVIGNPNYPALSRTYVGATSGISLSSDVQLSGNLYAGYGLVSPSSELEVFGSVFAGDVSALAAVKIHYDREVLSVGQDCPPGSGSAGGGPDGGPPPPPGGCNSCRDCGNQACVNGQCGACTTSAECCAPLLCVRGACVVTRPPG